MLKVEIYALGGSITDVFCNGHTLTWLTRKLSNRNIVLYSTFGKDLREALATL
jgi:hypothetical protein